VNCHAGLILLEAGKNVDGKSFAKIKED